VIKTCALLWFSGIMLAAGTYELFGAEPARPKTPRKVDPAFAPVVDDPTLPRVLLIGDSISIGYTVATRELLKGKANVHRIPENGGPTKNGLAKIDKWLGTSHWDVIHFNWGLHDLKAMPDGTLQVPLAQYEQNMRELVKRLNATGATLIWCNTTPVPPGSALRKPEDVAPYNTAAKKIMEENKIAIDDLNRFAQARLSEIQLPANVHFSAAGSAVLAQQVAESIASALSKKGA
jgi:hypothetical protein